MAKHIEGALFLQLPNGFLDEHFFRVLRVALAELFPSIWPGLLEITNQVFRIHGIHLVVLGRLADQPTLIVQGCDDVVLERSLSAVSHDYSLYPLTRLVPDFRLNTLNIVLYLIADDLVARFNDVNASSAITDGLALREIIFQVCRECWCGKAPRELTVFKGQLVARASQINQLLPEGLAIIREFLTLRTVMGWSINGKYSTSAPKN